MGEKIMVSQGGGGCKVAFQGMHCTFSNNLIKVKKGGTVSVRVYPESGYVLEQVVTSILYEYVYDRVTNVLTIANVTDNLTVTVNYAAFTQSYTYTGARETLTIPHTGYYEVETGGASGGVYSGVNPAKGGLIRAILAFNRDDKLYIYCGNCGGNASRPGAGAGGYGHQNGTAGTAGTMGSDQGYGYGGGGGGSSRVMLDNDSKYVSASGGGGSGGFGTGNTTGGSGGTSGKGGGPDGGAATGPDHTPYNAGPVVGKPGGARAVGATQIITQIVGGNGSENKAYTGYAKITYLGISL